VVASVYILPLCNTLVTEEYDNVYPQLILTIVGRLNPVAGSIGLFLCHNLITSKQSPIEMPVPESPAPSKPETFRE
jgi:hypothetical protein